MGKFMDWADAHLIDGWRTEWRRLWSLRVAAFWSAVGGIVALAPMVSDEAKAIVGPQAFAIVFMASFVSVTIARVLKQPGAEE